MKKRLRKLTRKTFFFSIYHFLLFWYMNQHQSKCFLCELTGLSGFSHLIIIDLEFFRRVFQNACTTLSLNWIKYWIHIAGFFFFFSIEDTIWSASSICMIDLKVHMCWYFESDDGANSQNFYVCKYSVEICKLLWKNPQVI